MFVKLFIAILIVSVGALIGIKKAKAYEERETIIRESITLFNRIANDIKYNMTALPNAIESARQGFNTRFKDVLGSISTSLLDNSYTDVFVAQEMDVLDTLKAYDKQIITQGIQSLGNSDADTQINLINGTIASLNELVSEAREEKNKNSKLYKTVGLVAGLMIAIVIM